MSVVCSTLPKIHDGPFVFSQEYMMELLSSIAGIWGVGAAKPQEGGRKGEQS